jgi:hypothetical protein
MFHVCNAQYSSKVKMLVLTHHDPDKEDHEGLRHLLYHDISQEKWQEMAALPDGDEPAALAYWEENLKGQHGEKQIDDLVRQIADLCGLEAIADI